MRLELADDKGRQPHRSPPGSRLRRPEEQLALHLRDGLGHSDRSAQQIDAAPADTGQLPDAETAVGALGTAVAEAADSGSAAPTAEPAPNTRTGRPSGSRLGSVVGDGQLVNPGLQHPRDGRVESSMGWPSAAHEVASSLTEIDRHATEAGINLWEASSSV
jgi:hypothetical protein